MLEFVGRMRDHLFPDRCSEIIEQLVLLTVARRRAVTRPIERVAETLLVVQRQFVDDHLDDGPQAGARLPNNEDHPVVALLEVQAHPMDEVRLSRAGSAENGGEDVGAILAKEILEERCGAHVAKRGAAYQFLERGADRRTDFQYPVAMDRAEQTVWSMLCIRIDDLADLSGVPTYDVAHHYVAFLPT